MSSTSENSLIHDAPDAKMYMLAVVISFSMHNFDCDNETKSHVRKSYGLGHFIDSILAQRLPGCGEEHTAHLGKPSRPNPGQAGFTIRSIFEPNKVWLLDEPSLPEPEQVGFLLTGNDYFDIHGVPVKSEFKVINGLLDLTFNETVIVQAGNGRKLSISISNGEVLCRACDVEEQSMWAPCFQTRLRFFLSR